MSATLQPGLPYLSFRSPPAPATGPSSVPQACPRLSSGCPLTCLLLGQPASSYCSFYYHLHFCSGLSSEAASLDRLSIHLPQLKSTSLLPVSLVTLCIAFLVVVSEKELYQGKEFIASIHQCSVHGLHVEIFLNEGTNDVV